MKLKLYDKEKDKTLEVDGEVGASNLNFTFPEYSGNLTTTPFDSIQIFVSSRPNGINEFGTIAEALEYVSKYKTTYDKDNNKWVTITIKAGYIINESTYIHNQQFHRVVIKSEDPVVSVNVDGLTLGNQVDAYSWKSVICGHHNTVLPIIDFSIKANRELRSDEYIVGFYVLFGSFLIVKPSRSIDGFWYGIRVGCTSNGNTRGVNVKNCTYGLGVDDCSTVYCHSMVLENCQVGLSAEQLSMVDIHVSNFIYGPKSISAVTCGLHCGVWAGGATITNWTNKTAKVFVVSHQARLLISGVNTSTSPGIQLTNIAVNTQTTEGFIIQ